MPKKAKYYPEEFKIQAVRRYYENGKRAKFTGRELEVPDATLRGWVKSYMEKDKDPKKSKAFKKEEDLSCLLKEKENRIRELEEENLILKKSIGIFTRDSRQK